MKKITRMAVTAIVSLTKAAGKVAFQKITGQNSKKVVIPEYRSNRVPVVDLRKKDPSVQPGQLLTQKSLQDKEFDVADRIVTIRLDPPVGVVNLRVYNASQTIKRDLLIYEPRLRAIMKGRRFTLTSASTRGGANGIEALKKETVKEVEDLINKLGNTHVKPKDDQIKLAELKVEQKTAKVQEAKAPVPKAEVAPPPKPTPPAPSMQKQAFKPAQKPLDAPAAKVYTPVMPGHIYEGMLKYAGTKTMTPPNGGNPYEIFQAVLVLDNGAEMPLRGAELERELTGASCQVGDRVAIRPMGKVPVTLANGTEGSKNLYQVQKM